MVGTCARDLGHRADAAAGHLDVEQADVRALARRAAAIASSAVARLGADLAAAALERHADAGARRRVVVGDEDAHGASRQHAPRPSCRRRARRRSSKLPPSDSVRSRMLVSPKLWLERGASGSKPPPSSMTRSQTPSPSRSSRVTVRAWPWRAAFATASRAIRSSASRHSGGTSMPALEVECSRAPTRSATSCAAWPSATSSGSSIGRLSAAIAPRDSSSARSTASRICPSGCALVGLAQRTTASATR